VKALRPISYTSKDFSPIASDNTISKMAAAEGKTFSQQKKVERDKAPLIRGSDDLQWGFVAHELQEVLVPTAATGTKDMEDGMQAPQWAPILAAVTKALQEAQVRIEELERIIQSIAGDGQDKDKTWPVM
jgi:transposase